MKQGKLKFKYWIRALSNIDAKAYLAAIEELSDLQVSLSTTFTINPFFDTFKARDILSFETERLKRYINYLESKSNYILAKGE